MEEGGEEKEEGPARPEVVSRPPGKLLPADPGRPCGLSPAPAETQSFLYQLRVLLPFSSTSLTPHCLSDSPSRYSFQILSFSSSLQVNPTTPSGMSFPPK